MIEMMNVCKNSKSVNRGSLISGYITLGWMRSQLRKLRGNMS